MARMSRPTDKPQPGAWRFALTAEDALKSLEPEPTEEAEALPEDEGDADLARTQLRAEAQAGAEEIVAALHAGGEPLQVARAVYACAAEKLWGVLALAARPEAQVVAELLVRHFDELDSGDSGGPGSTLSWLNPFERPWFDDLAALMAAKGLSPWQVFGLVPPDADVAERYPGLGDQLVEVLQRPQATPRERLAAAHWLGCGDWPRAVGALQAALREPRLSLRVAAGEALVRFGHLTADDTRFLLEDTAERELYGEEFELELRYGDLLVDAVTDAPCAEAPELLRRIEHVQWSLNSVAPRALVAGFPGDALAMLRDYVREFQPGPRAEAVHCLARLERGAAAPLLRDLCSDPVPSVAKVARDAWLEQHGESPPAATPILGTSLLPGGPSARFELRATLLRQAPVEGRVVVLRALRAERPRGRAKLERALLLLHAACDPALGPQKARGRLGKTFHALALRLCREVGPRLVDAVLEYVARFPLAEWPPWGELLAKLARRGLLQPAHRVRVQRLAAQWLTDAATQPAAVGLFAAVGVAPESLAALLALQGRKSRGVDSAVEDTPPSRAWVRALLRAIDDTLDKGDWTHVRLLATAAHGCRAVGLDARLKRALALGRVQRQDSLSWLVRLMQERHLLPRDYFEQALTGPDLVEAEWALYGVERLTARQEALVFAALEGPLAPEAARVVIMRELGSWTRAQWRALLKRLPTEVADRVLVSLAFRAPAAWVEECAVALERVQGDDLRFLCTAMMRERPELVREVAARRPADAEEMLSAIGQETRLTWLAESPAE